MLNNYKDTQNEHEKTQNDHRSAELQKGVYKETQHDCKETNKMTKTKTTTTIQEDYKDTQNNNKKTKQLTTTKKRRRLWRHKMTAER